MTVTLTPHQQHAVDQIAEWWKNPTQPFRLGGLAGTGKTTTMAHVAEALNVLPRFVTPTWKAADVLSSKLPNGQRATSVHNLLYTPTGTIHDEDCNFHLLGECDMQCSDPAFTYDPV